MRGLYDPWPDVVPDRMRHFKPRPIRFRQGRGWCRDIDQTSRNGLITWTVVRTIRGKRYTWCVCIDREQLEMGGPWLAAEKLRELRYLQRKDIKDINGEAR